MNTSSKKPAVGSILFVLILLFLLVALPLAADEKFPEPMGPVNDFAGVIPSQYKRSMNNLAIEVMQKTGASVVVATFKSIGDSDPADFANRLYEAWGIGKEGQDKGVLILLAVRERRVRIETGYGIEGILPDGLTGEILDRYVIPYLKKGDYGRGLSNAMIAVSSLMAKDAEVSLNGEQSIGKSRIRRASPVSSLFTLIIFILILIPLLGTRRGRAILPFLLLMLLMGGGGRSTGSFGSFGGGFGGFGGGMSGGGGAGRGF
jgi:uncharacterized protein